RVHCARPRTADALLFYECGRQPAQARLAKYGHFHADFLVCLRALRAPVESRQVQLEATCILGEVLVTQFTFEQQVSHFLALALLLGADVRTRSGNSARMTLKRHVQAFEVNAIAVFLDHALECGMQTPTMR